MWLFDGVDFCEYPTKESLGEYGSGWGWDSNVHVLSYEYGDNTPVKYNNMISTSKPNIVGTWVDYGDSKSAPEDKRCSIEITDGRLLVSDFQLVNNISCEPHTYNAGNYYSFMSVSASSFEPATRSICPRGWSLSGFRYETNYSVLLDIYGVDYNAATKTNPYTGLRNLPLSFLSVGYYNTSGSMEYRGSLGHYRMVSLSLNIGGPKPNDYTNGERGYPVRCVSR